MPGAEEDPERPDGAAPVPVRRRAGGRLLVPLVVAGATVVVLSTAAEGRASLTPFLTLGTRAPEEQLPGTGPTAGPTPPPPGPLGSAADTTVQTVLTVLALVVGIVVAIVLIRLLVSAIRARRRRPERLRAGGAETEAEVRTADAPTVLRGIAAALVAFDDDREPSDAVVQAWLGLQQAAEDAGFARSAAETPTEFTGRVLTRTGADRVALQRLLRLYLRARFGDGAITAADVTDAQDALRALEASWERVTREHRG